MRPAMVTTAAAMVLAVLPAERGGDAGTGGFEATQHLIARFFQRGGAGQRGVEITREAGAVVLHDGEFFLDVGVGEIIFDSGRRRALKLIEGG